MSLLGNRGRFSSDKVNFNNRFDFELKSELSLLGTNPSSLFNIKKDDDANNDLKERISKADLDDYNNRVNSKHELYNDNLNRVKRKKDVKYGDKRQTNSKLVFEKKRISIKTIILMIVIEVITIFGIINISSVIRLSKMTQIVPFDPKVVISPYIDESTINIMKGYKTVAIFGVDSRNGSVAQGNNADVNLIINLNVENGDVEIISIYRDLYLSVTDGNSYDKLNSAYRRGGPEAAVKVLNKSLDLNITNFFAFNWKAVADGIELLGGIDLDISKAEYKYMNAFIHETCIATGIDAKNPAAHYVKSAGMQHLDGVQAVAYGRLRLMDSDFQRVDRQKEVIMLCLQKAKTLDIPTLRMILEAVLPQIAYEFDMNEMVSLLRIIRNVTIVESTSCPETSNVVTMDMGSSGACVVPINLEKAVVKLHKILFNEEDYTVSTAVKRYSARISELRHKYQEENAINESIKQSLEAESLSQASSGSSSGGSKTNKSTKSTVSTRSNIPAKQSSASNLPINTDANIYPEEPENDKNLPIDSLPVPNAVPNATPNAGQNSIPNAAPVAVPNNEPNTVANNETHVAVVVEGPPGLSNNVIESSSIEPLPISNAPISSDGPSVSETSIVEPVIVIP